MATHEFAAHASHAHEAPQGFIRKWVFSLDHKVIGLQYYFLALAAVVGGILLSLVIRVYLIWAGAGVPVFCDDQAGLYPTLGRSPRPDYGFRRAYAGAEGRLRHLLPADSNRRAGYGVPGFEHALVLDDPSRLHSDDRGILRRGWRAAPWLDRLRAAERSAIRRAG